LALRRKNILASPIRDGQHGKRRHGTWAQIEFAQCVKISRKFRIALAATNGVKKQPVWSEEEADQPFESAVQFGQYSHLAAVISEEQDMSGQIAALSDISSPEYHDGAKGIPRPTCRWSM
jgi:hypothetical protein